LGRGGIAHNPQPPIPNPQSPIPNDLFISEQLIIIYFKK